MKRSRSCAAAAIATAAAIALSSCSFKRAIVFNSRRDINVPPSISFSWWGSETRNAYTLQGLGIFEDDNKNKLTIQPFPYDFEGYKSNLDALVNCGKECDLMQINSSWLNSLAVEQDALYDLNELKDHIDLDNFTEEQLNYCTINGKLYGLPTSLNAITFYHNSFVYAKYALNPPETWDDIFAAADLMSPDGVYVLESYPKHYWIMLVAHEEQITGRSAFGDGFDTDNVISMMNFYKELIDRKVIPTENFSKELFFEGRCASEALWVSDADFYAEPVEDHHGLLQVGRCLSCTDQKRLGWYVKPNQVYSIKKNTKHPEETADLLNFLVNDARMAELQGTEKGIPLSKSALEVLEANKMLTGAAYEAGKLINDDLENYELMPAELEETGRYEAFFEQFLLFENGEKTVEEAAGDFVKEYPFK